MTPASFRRLALSLPDAVEGSHMGHPDFRVRGRIFATLGHPDSARGMVKLTPDQQADVLETDRSASFSPASGAWGRQGATMVNLAAADRELVRVALEAAWRNRAEPAKRKKPRRS